MLRKRHKVGIVLIIILLSIILFPKVSVNIVKKTGESLVFGMGANLEVKDDRTNLLLLGIGGVTHDGGELTDTILIASLNHTNNTIQMISVPRDLMVKNGAPEYFNGEYVKVNTSYWIGKKQDPDNRFNYVRQVLKEVTDLNIHYTMLVDFKGFAEVIDALGGLVIDVENSFTDREYPNSSYGYMTINFQEGKQLMNGKRSLQYVRSRHGNNGEQGDFARSKRQQNIISGIKDKAFSLDLLTNPSKLESLYSVVQSNFITNITLRELIAIGRFAKDINSSSITKLAITEGDDGLLYVPEYSYRKKHFDGVYGFMPDGESFVYIHQLIKAYLKNPSILSSDFEVDVLNGTKTPGLANEISTPLKSRGYRIARVGNTYNRKKYDESVIIDHTNNSFPEKIAQIRTLTGIHNVVTTNIEPNLYRTDVTVIIGEDY